MDSIEYRTEDIKQDILEGGLKALRTHFAGGWMNMRANTQDAILRRYGGPARRDGETRDEYKARRRIINALERGILRGTPVKGL